MSNFMQDAIHMTDGELFMKYWGLYVVLLICAAILGLAVGMKESDIDDDDDDESLD